MGNSLDATTFRGFVELVSEEDFPEEELNPLIDRIGLFSLSLKLEEFHAQFSLRECKRLITKRPLISKILLHACISHLPSPISVLLLCRLIPSYFFTKTTLDTALQREVVNFCAAQHFEPSLVSTLFLLACSQPLFSKRDDLLNTRGMEEVKFDLDTVVPMLFSRPNNSLALLCVLCDIQHCDFIRPLVKDFTQALTVLIKGLGEGDDLVPSLIILLRLCEEDAMVEMTGHNIAQLANVMERVAEILSASSNQEEMIVIQLCSVLLLCLSAQREVCMELNSGSTTASNTKMEKILSCIYVFVKKDSKFPPLQQLALSALNNLAYYCSHLSFDTSLPWVDLFSTWRRTQGKEEWTSLLVDFFAHVLQFQGMGNERLLYTMFRVQNEFWDCKEVTSESMEICLLALNEMEEKMTFPTTTVAANTEDILAHLRSTVSLTRVLPPSRPILVFKYARNETINQVIRKCFWVDLFRGSDELWDFWRE